MSSDLYAEAASDELRELYETWLETGKPEREPDKRG